MNRKIILVGIVVAALALYGTVRIASYLIQQEYRSPARVEAVDDDVHPEAVHRNRGFDTPVQVVERCLIGERDR